MAHFQTGFSLDLSHDLQVLRAGDVVVDAGAGFGVSALAFAKVVGSSGSVHAFEAQRVLSQLVCSTAATNQVRVAITMTLSVVLVIHVMWQASNIRCINKALGASKGEIVVPELDLDQEVCFVAFVFCCFVEADACGNVTRAGRATMAARLSIPATSTANP